MMKVPPKRMVMVSMIAAGIVTLLALLDLAAGIPYGRMMLMDIMFLLSGGIVLYLSWETFRELS